MFQFEDTGGELVMIKRWPGLLGLFGNFCLALVHGFFAAIDFFFTLVEPESSVTNA